MMNKKDILLKLFTKYAMPGGAGPVTPEKKQELLNGTSLETGRHTLRAQAKFLLAYLSSDEKWKARGILALAVASMLAINGVSVWLNLWQSSLGDTLEHRNWADFMTQMKIFGGIAAASVATGWLSDYFQQSFQLGWQRWLTNRLTDRLVQNSAYHRLKTIYQSVSNPDQNITDDVEKCTDAVTSLTFGALRASLTVMSFTPILWNLSANLNLSVLGGPDMEIHKPMFWLAFAYAVGGTGLTYVLGKPLEKFYANLKNNLGNHRYALVRFFENAESIAMYRGEKIERQILKSRFNAVADEKWSILGRTRAVGSLQNLLAQGAFILPYFLASPAYFAGVMGLGSMFSTADAFRNLRDALNWFGPAYPQIAEVRAVTSRLMDFDAAVEKSNQDLLKEQEGRNFITVSREGRSRNIVIRDLVLEDKTPDDEKKPKTLIQKFSLTIRPGERLMITGPAGSGKARLQRAFAGLWPYGSGDIVLPRTAKIMFEPQTTYLTLASLRDILCYPEPSGTFKKHEMEEALRAVGHEELIKYLDDEKTQGDSFSKNLQHDQKQRLAFARILLHKPSFLMLDDTTGALDDAAAAELYKLVVDRMPKTTVISVVHRAELGVYHTLRADITPEKTLTCVPIENPALAVPDLQNGEDVEESPANPDRPRKGLWEKLSALFAAGNGNNRDKTPPPAPPPLRYAP